MPQFDNLTQTAIDQAKCATPEDEEIRIEVVFSSLINLDSIRNTFQELANALPKLDNLTEKTDRRKTEPLLRELLKTSVDNNGLVFAHHLFQSILTHPELRKRLKAYTELIDDALKRLPLFEFMHSAEREALLVKLGSFGKILTDQDITPINLCGRERFFGPICRSLMKMKRNDALLVGPSGVGKSALIKEFARRVSKRDPSIPKALHGAEIFQLSAEQLRAGVVTRPQYQRAVRQLMDLLAKHPKIILVISPMDAILAKDSRRSESLAAEEAICDLVRSDIPVIACLRPAGHLIMDSRQEWNNLFDVYKIPEPKPDRIVEILKAILPEFKSHYGDIVVEGNVLNMVSDYAQRLNPTQCEPRRSVQLLDELFVRAVTSTPPLTKLDPESLEQILSEPIMPDGGKIVYSQEELYERLTERIIGQDKIMQDISAMISTRLSKWATTDRPRGVFLFGGPTGVGKTETAVQLAEILSGSPNNLIRVNCNTLQPTGNQKTSVIWSLLGVPPGYVGHGEGGVLSQIRDKPNAVVLFDEFEKADPAVGQLLLQIVDTGLQRDNNGVLLDFRSSFIIFTSNLGCDYEGEAAAVGFAGSKARGKKKRPVVIEDKLRSELKMMGYGPEFLARVHQIFFFQALTDQAIEDIIAKQIDLLETMVATQGYLLSTADDFAQQVAAAYEPRDGVRGVINRLQAEFTRAMSQADISGDLDGVTTIGLRYGNLDNHNDGNTYFIFLK